VFSKLYNRIERRSEWLELARSIADFAARFGWDDEAGGWNLRLGGDGEVLDGPKSIYTDGFAIYGLAELARATGEAEPVELARKTADSVLRRLQAPPDQIPAWPYPTPAGAKVHGIPMIFSLVLWELGRLTGEGRYLSAAGEMGDEVFAHFYRPDRGLLLERIAVDNSECPPPAGTAVVPGHVIEDMWFQISIARDRGDGERIARACEIIRRHLEVGWDGEHGGLLLAVDADGRDEVDWGYADAKLWWPHTEALVATLLACEHTRADWALDWHEKVREYGFAHYPVAEHGEWRQRLNRQGRPLDEVIALPVKDPFHLPRALIYCIDVLERLTGS
jgi:N-acylglucosamine 2-epimerase